MRVRLLSNRKYQSGVSLVELLLVLTAIGFLAMLLMNIPSAINSINKSQHSSMARDIANKQIDAIRKQGFENLANGQDTFNDPKLNQLPDSSAIYEISDCPLEICTNGEEIKKIDVKVSWKEVTEDKSVEINTLIGKGGLAQ